MKYVTMILVFFHLVAGGALAAPDANVVLNTKHKLPVAPEVERFILEGSSSVFIKKGMFGGASTDINYELHNIELMLHKDIPPMFFEIKQKNYEGKYRVIYMTKPVVSANANLPLMSSPPPYRGGIDSEVYVKGILLNGASKALTITPWISLRNLKIDIAE
ncbi:hypothetical protein [Vibrio owensii]